MTEKTKNIGLAKPDETEFYDVNVTNENWDITDREIGNIKNPEIKEVSARENIENGDNYFTILGKIKRFFSDLKNVAFTGKYQDLEGKPEIPAAVAVKGDAEESYRTGNVNIGLSDIIFKTNRIGANVSDKYRFIGNVDDLYHKADCGCYWVCCGENEVQHATGTHPSADDHFYMLEVIGSHIGVIIQKAYTFDSCKTFYRMYTNSKWYAWTKANVTGVKGSKETTYRTGNINLTPENIGAVATGGNTAENTIVFTAASARENLKSGESHATLFGKIAKWFADLKAVAFSGSYNDLSNKPTIPSVGNGTVIITQNGANKGTFTMNQSGNTTIELTDNNTTYDLSKYLLLAGGTLTGKLTTRGGFTAENDLYMINDKWLKTANIAGTLTMLLGMNGSNNVHMGDYSGANASPVFLHAKGKQYNFQDTYFGPNITNNVTLGSSGKLWSTVYAKTGTINTSDRTKKHDIKDLTEPYEKLFLKLQPKSFIFNDGDRVHIGAISQDVEDAMQELGIEPKQFAGFCKDIRYEYTEYNEEDETPVESSKVPCKDEDGNIIYDYALRYQEFIFLTVHMVQKLWNRVEILEKENAEMKEQIKSMQQDITELKKTRA